MELLTSKLIEGTNETGGKKNHCSKIRVKRKRNIEGKE